MYLFFYVARGLNDFDAGTSINRALGGGDPCNEWCPHQNHYVQHHINNRYINRYLYYVRMNLFHFIL
jgi:hypothetical protein